MHSFMEMLPIGRKTGGGDFKNSLLGATVHFDEKLMGDRGEFSWKGFGIAALGFWIFYIFSAFLVILLHVRLASSRCNSRYY
jgi:hypothetical protein